MADPVFKKDKVYQKFNLKEIFGEDFSDMPELKDAIGQAIIDKIVKRTEAGLAIGGKRELKAYAKAYKDSLAFKAAGKKPGEVNMELTGDMMGLLDIIDESTNTISVGWDDELQSAKAFNHNTGDTLPKRPFFGLNKTEVNDLRKQFQSDIKDAVRALRQDGRDAFTEKIASLVKDISSDSEDDNG